jgi:CDP-diacylglycerol--serine O-phosphatidyltransferase
MPAPAVAGTAMLPLNLGFLGLADIPAGIVAAYVLALAALAVSTVPVYAGKNHVLAGWKRAAVPVLAVLAVIIGLLIAYPWTVLTVVAAAYLAGMPVGFVYHRRLKRRFVVPAPLPAAGYGDSSGVLAPAAAAAEQTPKG